MLRPIPLHYRYEMLLSNRAHILIYDNMYSLNSYKVLKLHSQCWTPLAWLSGSGSSHMLSQYGRMIHFTILTLQSSSPGISTTRMSKWLSISQGSRILMGSSLHQSNFVYVGKGSVPWLRQEETIYKLKFWKIQYRFHVKYPQYVRTHWLKTVKFSKLCVNHVMNNLRVYLWTNKFLQHLVIFWCGFHACI